MNFISPSNSLTIAGININVKIRSLIRLPKSTQGRKNKNPSAVAAKRSLSVCSLGEKLLLREFFIHCERGEAILWMPVSDVYVASLEQSGLIVKILGGVKDIQFGSLACYKIDPCALKIMIECSSLKYYYTNDSIERNSRYEPFKNWSEVTYNVSSWAWDASYRNRFRALDEMGFNRRDPAGGNPEGRLPYFLSPQCRGLNGDPVEMVFKEACIHGKSGMNSPAGRMPPKRASFLCWLFCE